MRPGSGTLSVGSCSPSRTSTPAFLRSTRTSAGHHQPRIRRLRIGRCWIAGSCRLATVEAESDRLLERYEATNAAKAVMTFFDEDVSKWYVRQSRHRFYDVDG